MTSQGVLERRRDGDVVELRLNRPEKLNALNDALFDELLSATAAVAGDRSVRAVILSGAGRAFCAGLDLATFEVYADEAEAGERPFSRPGDPDRGRRRPGRGQQIVRALRTNPAPVIAALQGPVIGGGLQLALGADIRLVTPDAQLAVREIDFGITPDMGGTQILPRLVGVDRALELILTGRTVLGEEAVEIGLATRVVPEPLAAARELARHIAGRSPDAVVGAKALVRLSERASLDEGLAAELEFMADNIGRPNQVEATRARLGKRAPRFTSD